MMDIVNGLRYDTDQSTLLHSASRSSHLAGSGYGSWHAVETTRLYRSKGGRLFYMMETEPCPRWFERLFGITPPSCRTQITPVDATKAWRWLLCSGGDTSLVDAPPEA